MRRRGLVFCAAVIFAASASAAEEYRFDVGAFEKKSFELNGYAELRADRFWLDRDRALYRLNYFDKESRRYLDGTAGAAEISGLYRAGIATFQATAHGELSDDNLGSDRETTLYEAYLTLEPATGTRLETGKRALRWGKGYAWSPVGFVERTKDPNDPELSREGFVMLGGGFTRSFDGPLKTITFTPLIVPTTGNLNGGFGSGNHINPAARLSLLYRDTDIDFLVLGEGARSARYGFDFSRNLGTNFEVHGEWAHITKSSKPVLDTNGTSTTQTADVTSYLLGMRYLTERDTTWIVEYYRNGTGYTESEMRDYFTLVQTGYDDFLNTGSTTKLERARVQQSNYVRANPMQRYLYVRVSQKEPFDILYFTPSVTVIRNLDDQSYSAAPEVTYTGITNLELRLRMFFLQGGQLTDFGEKQNDRRIELRARYYF